MQAQHWNSGGHLLGAAAEAMRQPADHTIKVWDARPWTPELRRQREALGLVELLCQKSPSKEKVAERIRAHKSFTEDVRQEA
jgi:hypothetical protein